MKTLLCVIVVLTILAGAKKALAEDCISDYQCGYGSHCVKAPYQATGVCMKEVNEYGTPQYNLPRPESVYPRRDGTEECQYITDCPVGFQCDWKYKVCVRR